ncbi:hypothetical protein JW978_01220 [Candidatus Dojkabacteria bacterium]|nr:hypothetical protein [Candidatus Dojkabacteria bacterium]
MRIIDKINSFYKTHRLLCLITLGLVIRLILSFVARHTWDFWLNYETVDQMWAMGGPKHIYEAGEIMIEGAGQIWFYGPVATFALALPSLIVGGFNSWNHLHVFIGHLPYLFFETIALLSFMKLTPAKWQKRFIFILWLGPFWIYLNYAYAQIDIIAASLNLVAMAFLINISPEKFALTKKKILYLALAGLFCALALHFKTGHLIGVAACYWAVIIETKKLSIKDIFLKLSIFTSSLVFFAGLIAFASWKFFPGYYSAITGGPTSYIFADNAFGISTIWTIIIVFIILAIILGTQKYLSKSLTLPNWKIICTELFAIVIFCLFLGMDFHPHWLVWSLPVWVLIAKYSEITKYFYRLLLIYGTYVLLTYDWVTSYRTFDMILYKVVPKYDVYNFIWQKNVISALSIRSETGFLFSFIFTAVVAIILLYPYLNERTNKQANQKIK